MTLLVCSVGPESAFVNGVETPEGVRSLLARWRRSGVARLPVAAVEADRRRVCAAAGWSGLPAAVPVDDAARWFGSVPVPAALVSLFARHACRLDPAARGSLVGLWSAAVRAV